MHLKHENMKYVWYICICPDVIIDVHNTPQKKW